MRFKNWVKAHPLACWMILLIIGKTMLAGGLAICAYSQNVHDDALMVEMAGNLLQGKWLGAYNERILAKGLTFPLYLALNHLTGIPYTVSMTVLYGLACALLTFTVGKLVKNTKLLAIFFSVLYLAPVNACLETLTRVYRNSLLPVLVLVLFACLLRMYLNRAGKGYVFWGVYAGLTLTVFWNLREDSIWLAPLTVAVCVITVVGVGMENRRRDEKWLRFNLLYAFLPLILLFAVNTSIRAVNYANYGVFVRNELQEGGFSELMSAINSVQPEEEIDYVSVPKSTVDKLYKVSPTFAQLQPLLNANFNQGWDQTDGTLDGQIHDGYFYWCLRQCIYQGGFGDTARKMNAFCSQAAAEINAAVKDGRLEKTSYYLMPSALMSPWHDSYAAKLPGAVNDAFWATARYYGCDLTTAASAGDYINVFEAMTHNLAVQPGSGQVSLTGWIVSYDDDVQVDLAVYQGDTQLAVLSKSGGEDVYEGYAAAGQTLENARNCRFNQVISVSSTEDLWLCVLRDGEVVDQGALNKDTAHGEGDSWAWALDAVSINTMEWSNALSLTVQPRVTILQHINLLYQKVGSVVTVIGLICYAALSVLLLVSGLRKKRWGLLDGWLAVTGLLESVLVLCCGIAYNSISAYPSISPIYLGGGYPLLTAANLLSILLALQETLRIRRSREELPHSSS